MMAAIFFLIISKSTESLTRLLLCRSWGGRLRRPPHRPCTRRLVLVSRSYGAGEAQQVRHRDVVVTLAVRDHRLEAGIVDVRFLVALEDTEDDFGDDSRPGRAELLALPDDLGLFE